ncbi:Bestrophin, RFP-TM, chloride channel-domain-containing protein [Amylostereum chailletii]|nr:Bestrophin, RFP-TM, chloride channel-domain-containing protein [Amylostereum chailletii]
MSPSVAAEPSIPKYSWLPDVFRIKNSIIRRILGPVLTVTAVAVAVAIASHKGRAVALTNSVTPLLAVVVTSYDRFYEGRKSFGALTHQVRNFTRLVWIQVALPPTDATPLGAIGKTPTADVTATHLHRRKSDVLKLSVLFAFAVKHYLREEDGLAWDDYADLIPKSFLRAHGYATRSGRTSVAMSYNALDSPDKSGATSPARITESPERDPVLASSGATKRVRVKRSIDKLVNSRTPLLDSGHRTVSFSSPEDASMPLPLVIAHEITRVLFSFRRDGLLETVGPAGANAMNQIVQGMVEQLTNLERIANTPIPKSYSIHLKQCVTLYLFALPFTLIRELGWATIPVVTVVAFTFMGIEGIADEIEMPFGLDDSDLPLDRYCHDLKEEVEYMIDRLPEGGIGGHGWDDGEGDD